MKSFSTFFGLLIIAGGSLTGQPEAPPQQALDGPRGPMMDEERELVKQFDKDGDDRLGKEERAAARGFIRQNPAPRRGPGGGGMRGPGPGWPGALGGPRGGKKEEPPVPGIRVSPADVKPESSSLYAPDTLRTLFLDFENADWEAELEAFHNTDVEVPATLTVDGKAYPGVGIHFRGMSSYMMVSAGHKRSLNVSLDFTRKKQRLDGYKTLNLLNSSGDGSFLSAVLYSHIARQYIPAPKVNLVRVVINGENWGVYVSQQQFNKDFIQENYRTGKGARWKVSGSPMGRGGLEYTGDDVAEYKKHFEMKDGDDDDWRALIKLCKTLHETPADQLAEALAPMLDIEGTLWFLALDCALINSDGYWIRASDYSLYRDKEGRFHLIPGDMNEAFRTPGGPGFGPRGADSPQPRVEGVKLDPLVGLDDAGKPLRSKLLAVPALRESYLAKVRTIAKDSLDWEKLGPVVTRYRELAGKEIAADTRKLSTTEEFENLTSETPASVKAEEGRRGPPGHGAMALKTFATERREFLLVPPAENAKDNR